MAIRSNCKQNFKYDNIDLVNISNTKDEYYLKRILKININAFNRFIFKNISNYSLLEFKVYILIKLILNEDIKNLKNKFELILENQLDSLSIHKTYNFLSMLNLLITLMKLF